ncbi:hypothetical protein EHR06_12100 [Leptospira dzoumogneensis]|uniref:Uncharacterized protein n=1 Tax=Leptospira dzoumogneensis TaxID=2484904 RepID=A0A4Z1AN04_9LEPT|nr:hypothetical protein EHR06_12100 [Leptospira dzoumogneensis]
MRDSNLLILSKLLHGRYFHQSRSFFYFANLLSELAAFHSLSEIFYSGITFPLSLLSFSCFSTVILCITGV